jgi:hypothetical protein
VPHVIEVLSVGGDYYAAIEDAAGYLNSLQEEFRFQPPPKRLKNDGLPIRRKHYHTQDVFAFLRRFRADAKGHRPFLIALVNGELQSEKYKNIFGSHEASEGLAVVTLHTHLRYVPSTRVFLCYYLIRYSLSFVEPALKSHNATRSCYFDFKEKKNDLLKSLQSGDFCDACMAVLEKKFSPEIY